MREATIERRTSETAISVTLRLDGSGAGRRATGVGFFDHMLDQLARHSLIDIEVAAQGDTHIDDHHTVEDSGIALGQALTRALGDKAGIRRYGECALAMDDTLVRAALDLSGRPWLGWNLPMTAPKIGSFDTELVREFFQALSTHGGITLHVDLLRGVNRTTSPRPRSRRWRGRSGWRSNPIRAPAACPRPRGRSEPRGRGPAGQAACIRRAGAAPRRSSHSATIRFGTQQAQAISG